MLPKLLTSIFGSRNDRLLKQYRQIAQKVNAFEPAFDLRQLGWGWSFVYGGFAVQCGAVAVMSANGTDVSKTARPSPLPLRDQVWWLALSAMGSVMR